MQPTPAQIEAFRHLLALTALEAYNGDDDSLGILIDVFGKVG